MANNIQIKRSKLNQPEQLLPGQMAHTEATQELFIGNFDGDGNIVIGGNKYVLQSQELTDGNGTPVRRAVRVEDLIGKIIDVEFDGETGEVIPADEPHAPVNVTGEAYFTGTKIKWDAPTYNGHAYAEVWRNTVNTVVGSELVGQSRTGALTDTVEMGSTHYYWVRFVNQDGVLGPFHADNTSGLELTTSRDISVVIEELADQIDESHLKTELNARLDKIDTSPDNLTDALATLDDQINDPSTGISVQLNAVDDQINNSTDGVLTRLDAAETDASNLATQVSDLDTDLQGQIDTIDTQINAVGTGIADRVSTVESDVSGLDATVNDASTGLVKVTGDLDNQINNATTGIAVTLSDLGDTVDTIDGRVSAAEGTITSQSSDISSLQTTIVQKANTDDVYELVNSGDLSQYNGTKLPVDNKVYRLPVKMSNSTGDTGVWIKLAEFKFPAGSSYKAAWIQGVINYGESERFKDSMTIKVHHEIHNTNDNYTTRFDVNHYGLNERIDIRFFTDFDGTDTYGYVYAFLGPWDGIAGTLDFYTRSVDTTLWQTGNNLGNTHVPSGTETLPVKNRNVEEGADVTATSTAFTGLDSRVTAAEGTISSHATDITQLQTDVSNAQTGVDGNASAIEAIDTRVTNAEGSITSQATDITQLQSDVSTAQSDATANAGAITALDTRVTSAEGTITTQSSDITTLQSDLKFNDNGANLLSDPNFTKTIGGETGHWVANQTKWDFGYHAENNRPGVTIDADGTINDMTSAKRIPATQGTRLYYYARLHLTSDFDGVSMVGAAEYDSNGSIVGYSSSSPVDGSPALGNWVDFFGYLTVNSATAVEIAPLFSVRESATVGTLTLGNVYVGWVPYADNTASSDAFTGLESRVTSAEGTITSQASDITQLQSDVTNAQNDADANATAITGLDTRVTSAENSLTTQSNDITQLQNQINSSNINLMPNFNYEGDYADHLEGGVIVDDATEGAANIYSGAHALKITGLAQFEDVWRQHFDGGFPEYLVDQQYTIGFWAKSTDTNDREFGYPGGGGYGNVTITGSSDWNWYTTQFTVPAGFTVSNDATLGDYVAYESRSTAAWNGAVYIDRIVLLRGSQVIDGNDTFVTNEAAFASSSAIDSLNTRVTANENTIASQATDITQLQTDVSNVEGTAGANSTAITSLDTRVTNAEGTITTQSSDISTLQSDLTTLDGQVGGNTSAISGLNTRLTNAEGSITSQASDITQLQTDVSAAQGDADANAGAISALDTRVTANEGSITSQSSDITNLQNEVTFGQVGNNLLPDPDFSKQLNGIASFWQGDGVVEQTGEGGASCIRIDAAPGTDFSESQTVEHFRLSNGERLYMYARVYVSNDYDDPDALNLGLTLHDDQNAISSYVGPGFIDATGKQGIWFDYFAELVISDPNVHSARFRMKANIGATTGHIKFGHVYVGRVPFADNTATSEAFTGLESRVTSAEGSITSQASDITQLQTDVTNAQGTADGNSTAITSLDSRVYSTEQSIASQASDITQLQSDVTAAQGDADANATAISGLDTRVTAAEGSITSQSSDITDLQNSVTDANVGENFIADPSFDKHAHGEGVFWQEQSNITIDFSGENGAACATLTGAGSITDLTQQRKKARINSGDRLYFYTRVYISSDLNAPAYFGTTVSRQDLSQYHWPTANLSNMTAVRDQWVDLQGVIDIGDSPDAYWVHARPTIRQDATTGFVKFQYVYLGRVPYADNTATSEAFTGLESRVTSAEGTITSQSADITSLRNDLTLSMVNLFPNSDFEGDFVDHLPPGTVISTDYAKDGTKSAMVTGLARWGDIFRFPYSKGFEPMVSGEKYTFGVWMKNTDTVNRALSMYSTRLSDGTSQNFFGPDNMTALAGSDWTFYQQTFIVPADTNPYHDNIRIEMYTDAAWNGNLYLDGVILLKGHHVLDGSEVFSENVQKHAASSAISGLDSRVTSAEGAITSQASDITQLQTDVTNAQGTADGNSTAISGLDSRVTTAEGTLTSQGSAITQLQSDVAGAQGDADANASAIGALDTRVTATETSITSQASDITALESGVANVSKLIEDPEFNLGFEAWSNTSNHQGSYIPNRWGGDETLTDQGVATKNDVWFFSRKAYKIDTSRTYRMRVRVRALSDGTVHSGAMFYAGVQTLDGNFVNLTGGSGTHRYFCASGQVLQVSQGWREFEGTITGEGDATAQFRPGTVYVRPMFIMNYQSSDPYDGAESEIAELYFEDITDAEANASAITSLDTRVTSAEGALTTQSSAITALENTVNDGSSGVAANASAISSIDTRVTSAEGTISTHSSDISALKNTVDDPDSGVAANATAVAAIEQRITDDGKVLTVQSSEFTNLNNTVTVTTATPLNPAITSLVQDANQKTVTITVDTQASDNATRYEIWNSFGDESDYAMIAEIPKNEVADGASFTVVDETINRETTVYYKVFAVNRDIYSTGSSNNINLALNLSDVTNLTVTASRLSYDLTWDNPDDPIFSHVEIRVEARVANDGGFLESNGTLIYSGKSTSFVYEVPVSDQAKFHKFWVKSIARN